MMSENPKDQVIAENRAEAARRLSASIEGRDPNRTSIGESLMAEYQATRGEPQASHERERDHREMEAGQ